MLNKDKGIYPKWISDSDIINLVLHEITKENGKLPYTYVVNPTHSPESQERMKMILARMRKEKLLLPHIAENSFLEIDVEGGMAVHLGYRKYRIMKKWSTLLGLARRFYLFIFVILSLALIGGIVYFILHYFRRV